MPNKNTGERETPAALPERETPATLIHTTSLQPNRTRLQLSMNITALLLLLGLMGAVCRSIACPQGCLPANYTHQYFKIVDPGLGNNPVAPWTILDDKEAGREPEIISYANCTGCTNGMKTKTIYVQISVYKKVLGTEQVCRCPYELAVGCTCDSKL